MMPNVYDIDPVLIRTNSKYESKIWRDIVYRISDLRFKCNDFGTESEDIMDELELIMSGIDSSFVPSWARSIPDGDE